VQLHEAAAGAEVAKAEEEVSSPSGATPEESQSDALGEPDPEAALMAFLDGTNKQKKPFGNEKITEDQADVMSL
jgi:hypothetical protein